MISCNHHAWLRFVIYFFYFFFILWDSENVRWTFRVFPSDSQTKAEMLSLEYHWQYTEPFFFSFSQSGHEEELSLSPVSSGGRDVKDLGGGEEFFKKSFRPALVGVGVRAREFSFLDRLKRRRKNLEEETDGFESLSVGTPLSLKDGSTRWPKYIWEIFIFRERERKKDDGGVRRLFDFCVRASVCMHN